MIEQFSVAEVSTPQLTFAEDLAICVDAEVGGIGISESKLGHGGDAGALAEFLACGLRATLAVPREHCILPGPQSAGPNDPAERIAMMCASVRRLAAFDPVAIGIQAGQTGTRGPAEARALIVHALRALGRTAASLHPRGFQVALEPVSPHWASRGWMVTSLADAAELIDEAAEPNLKIVLDTWHLGCPPMQDLKQFSDLIVLVQVADRQAGALAGNERVLPGRGDIDFARLVRALAGLGYRGWYELEVPPPGGAADGGQAARLRAAAEVTKAAQQYFRALYQSATAVPAPIGQARP